MGRIAATAIITKMVEDRNMFALALWDRLNQPSIHKAVSHIENFINSDLTVAIFAKPCPNPTSRDAVSFDFLPNPVGRFRTHIGNNKIIHTPIINDIHLLSRGNQNG